MTRQQLHCKLVFSIFAEGQRADKIQVYTRESEDIFSLRVFFESRACMCILRCLFFL